MAIIPFTLGLPSFMLCFVFQYSFPFFYLFNEYPSFLIDIMYSILHTFTLIKENIKYAFHYLLCVCVSILIKIENKNWHTNEIKWAATPSATTATVFLGDFFIGGKKIIDNYWHALHISNWWRWKWFMCIYITKRKEHSDWVLAIVRQIEKFQISDTKSNWML